VFQLSPQYGSFSVTCPTQWRARQHEKLSVRWLPTAGSNLIHLIQPFCTTLIFRSSRILFCLTVYGVHTTVAMVTKAQTSMKYTNTSWSVVFHYFIPDTSDFQNRLVHIITSN
jgi:hypothetical protein